LPSSKNASATAASKIKSLDCSAAPRTTHGVTMRSCIKQGEMKVAHNSNEFVRRLAGITETPKDKGVEMTVKVILYDNGMAQVNTHGFSNDDVVVTVVNVPRLFAQMYEELVIATCQRKSKKAA
jgi:hypothetical protein